MRFRFLPLFLAFLLFWSGLGAPEASRADGRGAAHHERLADGRPAADRHAGSAPHAAADGQAGSVGHHHLDDRPLQAHGDTPYESPAIVPAALPERRASAAERHAGAHRVAGAAPYLDGPLRPPRSAALGA